MRINKDPYTVYHSSHPVLMHGFYYVYTSSNSSIVTNFAADILNTGFYPYGICPALENQALLPCKLGSPVLAPELITETVVCSIASEVLYSYFEWRAGGRINSETNKAHSLLVETPLKWIVRRSCEEITKKLVDLERPLSPYFTIYGITKSITYNVIVKLFDGIVKAPIYNVLSKSFSYVLSKETMEAYKDEILKVLYSGIYKGVSHNVKSDVLQAVDAVTSENMSYQIPTLYDITTTVCAGIAIGVSLQTTYLGIKKLVSTFQTTTLATNTLPYYSSDQYMLKESALKSTALRLGGVLIGIALTSWTISHEETGEEEVEKTTQGNNSVGYFDDWIGHISELAFFTSSKEVAQEEVKNAELLDIHESFAGYQCLVNEDHLSSYWLPALACGVSDNFFA